MVTRNYKHDAESIARPAGGSAAQVPISQCHQQRAKVTQDLLVCDQHRSPHGVAERRRRVGIHHH